MTDKVLRLAPQSEITQEDTTKHTVVFDSYTYNLSVKATPCGLDVSYERTLTEKELKSFPDFLINVAPKTHTLVHEHIHPQWWWKFIFRTTETQLKRFIKETKKAAEDFQKHKAIVQKLGV